MRKKTMFLSMLGAGLMWMPTSGGCHWRNLDWCKREGGRYNKWCRY